MLHAATNKKTYFTQFVFYRFVVIAIWFFLVTLQPTLCLPKKKKRRIHNFEFCCDFNCNNYIVETLFSYFFFCCFEKFSNAFGKLRNEKFGQMEKMEITFCIQFKMIAFFLLLLQKIANIFLAFYFMVIAQINHKIIIVPTNFISFLTFVFIFLLE